MILLMLLKCVATFLVALILGFAVVTAEPSNRTQAISIIAFIFGVMGAIVAIGGVVFLRGPVHHMKEAGANLLPVGLGILATGALFYIIQ